MKGCATCRRLYSDDTGSCPIEGAALENTDDLRPKPDPNDPRVGSTICYGRYEIWRVLADGAMGRVYQALDRSRNRTVALKVLHARIAEDPIALERFHREFEISASVAHEHIVEIYAFELDPEGTRVLAMEYLEGEALRTLLKRQRVLPTERILRLFAQIAKGLEVAHEHQLVHRDLKPDNIFLCGSRDGDVVKILDFGSIRVNRAGVKRITIMGTTIGSPFYMAPEQAQGLAELDHRADVWSIAAIAYEAITGKVPFEGVGDGQILHAIIHKTHRLPSDVGKAYGVPRALDKIMDEALAKDPAKRMGSVGELVDRIGHVYGLEGSHLDWAAMPEAELRELLRIAQISRVAPEPEPQTTEDYSGMDAAFDAAFAAPKEQSLATLPSAPPTKPTRVAPPDDDAPIDRLPASKPWLLPVVLLVMFVVGMLIALALRK